MNRSASLLGGMRHTPDKHTCHPYTIASDLWGNPYFSDRAVVLLTSAVALGFVASPSEASQGEADTTACCKSFIFIFLPFCRA